MNKKKLKNKLEEIANRVWTDEQKELFGFPKKNGKVVIPEKIIDKIARNSKSKDSLPERVERLEAAQRDSLLYFNNHLGIILKINDDIKKIKDELNIKKK